MPTLSGVSASFVGGTDSLVQAKMSAVTASKESRLRSMLSGPPEVFVELAIRHIRK
jgi:hypothetical protein